MVSIMTFGMTCGSIRAESDEYSSLSKFQQIIYLVEKYYVKDVKVDKLIDGAIEGMVEQLDPYSAYMSPEIYHEMQLEFDGEYGGIGIVITTRNDKLTIVSPFKETPGSKAGLKAGDVISHINGKPTSEMSQKKAVDIMRGKPGSEVMLTIQREKESESD